MHLYTVTGDHEWCIQVGLYKYCLMAIYTVWVWRVLEEHTWPVIQGVIRRFWGWVHLLVQSLNPNAPSDSLTPQWKLLIKRFNVLSHSSCWGALMGGDKQHHVTGRRWWKQTKLQPREHLRWSTHSRRLVVNTPLRGLDYSLILSLASTLRGSPLWPVQIFGEPVGCIYTVTRDKVKQTRASSNAEDTWTTHRSIPQQEDKHKKPHLT